MHFQRSQDERITMILKSERRKKLQWCLLRGPVFLPVDEHSCCILYIYFLNVFFFLCPLSVSNVAGFCLSSASGMFYSPDQTTMFYQLGWSRNTEIAENPHGAIGHRLSATKAYENNVHWHGQKNFKDCGEFVNFFFL